MLTLLHTYLLITLISFLITSGILCVATLRHEQAPLPAVLPLLSRERVVPELSEQDTLLLPQAHAVAKPRKPP